MIYWRPVRDLDIELCVALQVRNRGDALVGLEAALKVWRQLVHEDSFASCVLEAQPSIQGKKLIGFAASVFVSRAFVQTEIANPRPDMTSRIIASVHAGRSVVATRAEIARGNAGTGLGVAVLTGCWHDHLLAPDVRQDLQTVIATSFAEWLAGYQVREILHETSDEPARAFAEQSVVYVPIAKFPEVGRVLHLMTRESANAMPASIGNMLFAYQRPVLRLRTSDQELLLAALTGETDQELAVKLGICFSAVKGRWRSTFARIAETMPELISDFDEHEGRGLQKRHRILAYVRLHREELRPFDWKGLSL